MMLNSYNDIQKPKFEEGEVVYEIGRPQNLMQVTRRNGLVYYCKSVENGKERDVAYMERDLKKKENAISPLNNKE